MNKHKVNRRKSKAEEQRINMLLQPRIIRQLNHCQTRLACQNKPCSFIIRTRPEQAVFEQSGPWLSRLPARAHFSLRAVLVVHAGDASLANGCKLRWDWSSDSLCFDVKAKAKCGSLFKLDRVEFVCTFEPFTPLPPSLRVAFINPAPAFSCRTDLNPL